MHVLHNFSYEVSIERALLFTIQCVFQGLLMKAVGDLTCNELKVFSMREIMM